jgi:hypothetical protein
LCESSVREAVEQRPRLREIGQLAINREYTQ